MVTRLPRRRTACRRAALMTEAVIALGILATAMVPLSFAFTHEMKLCRAYYYKAVAMEVIDGEMEVLAAGEWRTLPPGRQSYAMRAAAATNLPSGEFILTLREKRARLEWIPKAHGSGGTVAREAEVR